MPFSEDEYREIIESDRTSWSEQAVPATEAICLDEAIARAMKFNLDHRVNLLERVFAEAEFEAGRFDMLPRLMANAGYNWRNNDNIRDSIDSVTGEPSLSNPSISSARSRTTADLGLNWSLLDFGVSYYNAKQNADRLLVANERRRKAMYMLVLNVSDAYWRALAAQELRERVQISIQEAEGALNDSRQILDAQLQDPADTLRFQRNLLENLRLLENVERELAAAQIELASLIGLAPGTRVELLSPDWGGFGPIEVDMEELEVLALANNPDLREQAYNARIAAQETRKTMLRMMPGLDFNYGTSYDSDRFLVNEQWQQASVTVGYNLFNVLSTPAHRRSSRAWVELEEARRMALQLAVLSQVHMTHHFYYDSKRQYERARAIYEVDRGLSELAQRQQETQTGTALERVSREVAHILSTLRMYQAMARVSESAGQLQLTLGLEPQFGSMDDISLEELAQRVAQSQHQRQIGLTQSWGCSSGAPLTSLPDRL